MNPHGSHGSEHGEIAIGPSVPSAAFASSRSFFWYPSRAWRKKHRVGCDRDPGGVFLASNLHPISIMCVCSLFTEDQVGIPNQNTHTHTHFVYPNINERKFIAKFMDSLPSPKPTSASRLRRHLESLLFCFKSGFFLQDPCETLLSWLMTPPAERYQADWLKCNVDVEGQRGYNNEKKWICFTNWVHLYLQLCVW